MTKSVIASGSSRSNKKLLPARLTRTPLYLYGPPVPCLESLMGMVGEAPAGTLSNMAAAFYTRNGKKDSSNRTRLSLRKSAKRNSKRSKPARSQCLKKTLRTMLADMRSCERRKGSSTLKSSRENRNLNKTFLIILLSRRGHTKKSPCMIKGKSRRNKTERMPGAK